MFILWIFLKNERWSLIYKNNSKTGLPDDIQTYSLVSGVWTSMFALGAFTGATCSGLLYDIVGFRMGTFSILGLQLFVVIL